ncbi:MAG: DinB family protein [Thermoanaerobaculia bacterium]
MTEIERIVDQLHRSWAGDAWHGPALSELLEGVDARTAAARPISGAHSIWELVGHITTDYRTVTSRLKEWHGRDPSESENFPAVVDVGEKAWSAAREALERAHRELEATISAWPENRLADRVPDKTYSVYVMLHGTIQHGLYHGGQIALLKKAVISKAGASAAKPAQTP